MPFDKGDKTFNNFWSDHVGLAVSTNDGIKDCLLDLSMQGVRIDTRDEGIRQNCCGSECHGQIFVAREDTMHRQFLVVVLVTVKVNRTYTDTGYVVVVTATRG